MHDFLYVFLTAETIVAIESQGLDCCCLFSGEVVLAHILQQSPPLVTAEETPLWEWMSDRKSVV